MKNLNLRNALRALAFLAAASVASAGAITYTFTMTATGSVNGTAFTGVPLTFTSAGDTSNISNSTGYGPLVYENVISAGLTSFSVGAFNGTLTNLVDIWGCQNTTVCDGGANVVEFIPGILNGSEIDDFNPVFQTYALGASGPVNSSGTQLFLPFDAPTSSGALVISALQNLTFSATTTPEPGTLVLVSGALAALVGLKRKRSGRQHRG